MKLKIELLHTGKGFRIRRWVKHLVNTLVNLEEWFSYSCWKVWQLRFLPLTQLSRVDDAYGKKSFRFWPNFMPMKSTSFHWSSLHRSSVSSAITSSSSDRDWLLISWDWWCHETELVFSWRVKGRRGVKRLFTRFCALLEKMMSAWSRLSFVLVKRSFQISFEEVLLLLERWHVRRSARFLEVKPLNYRHSKHHQCSADSSRTHLKCQLMMMILLENKRTAPHWYHTRRCWRCWSWWLLHTLWWLFNGTEWMDYNPNFNTNVRNWNANGAILCLWHQWRQICECSITILLKIEITFISFWMTQQHKGPASHAGPKPSCRLTLMLQESWS